ncbi:putative membrane protein [Rhodococcus tukisamuensis]|uniref:Putative membrane protein n=1 Tax=Rhodococcus tukisamuensis TaxID=168276 RepID=A0A1G6QLH1_9NOCA|nr:putative membrane protein [Rhodococcus tukisamuensis]
MAKFAPDRGGHAVAAGLILMGAGLLVSAYGTLRYRAVDRQLESGQFAPATFAAIATTTIVTLLALVAVAVLL